jgi:hypothetical protein
MKLDPKSVFSSDRIHEIPADPVLSFFNMNRDGIWHAVRLLGGYESARIVDRCAELLARECRVIPRTRIMLDQILSVLSLEETDDPDFPFMGCFAVIDPSDPVVEEICLLTDGLRDALKRSDGQTAQKSQAPAA